MVFNLTVNGKAVATVTLIPNIEVLFYRAISVNASIEPALTATLTSELTTTDDILDEFPALTRTTTTADVTFATGCYLQADLKKLFGVGGAEVLPRTQVCDLGEYTLFSLPEIQPLRVIQDDGVVYVSADVSDGVNNPFNESSIYWFIDPPVENVGLDHPLVQN